MNLPVKFKHIMILTGEPSGDYHAAFLINHIQNLTPDVYVSGIGGPCLKEQGVDLFFDIDQLSAMGVTEVLMQFGKIKHAFNLFRQKINNRPPDLLILVDYPGFNLKAAQFAKEKFNTPVFYYITPKVWAWKKSRLYTIKKIVDHAALILPFEEKIFRSARVPSTYVGNPLVDAYSEQLSKPFCTPSPKKQGKPQITIGLLPGSRQAEIKNLLPVMIRAAELLLKKNNGIKFIISQSDSIDKEKIESFISQSQLPSAFTVYKGPVKNIFSACDLLIAASGTVTLEAALCCIPTILTYKVSPMTYRIGKLFVKLKYVGLANLIVNKEVMPELLQGDATAPKIALKAEEMLDHLPWFQTQLQMVRKFLGKKGAALRAAKIATTLLRNRPYR